MTYDQVPNEVAPMLATFSFTHTFTPRQLSIHSRTLMLVLSRVIEDTAARSPQTVLVAAFQRFSFVLPQLARYAQIAPALAHTYVIGMPDVALPPLDNVTYIPIEQTWPLLHEWVVLALGPGCCVGLFARDSAQQQPQERTDTFQGLWTTQPEVVATAYTAFSAALGQSTPHIARDTHATRETTRSLQQAMTARLRQHEKHRATR